MSLSNTEGTIYTMVEDTTPREFALAHALKVYNMWYPLSLISLARTKVWKPVSIPHSMPMALYDHNTQNIEYRRSAILQRLQHVTFTERSTLIALDGIPASVTLFARWVKPPVRKLPINSLLLYRPLNDDVAIAEGCVLPVTDINSSSSSLTTITTKNVHGSNNNNNIEREIKRNERYEVASSERVSMQSALSKESTEARTELSSSSSSSSSCPSAHPSQSSKSISTLINVNSLAEALRAGQSNQNKRQRSDEDLYKRFTKALTEIYEEKNKVQVQRHEEKEATEKPLVRTANKILEKTKTRIQSCLRKAPLHFVLNRQELTSSVVSLAHVVWSQPDPRILFHVFTTNVKITNNDRRMKENNSNSISNNRSNNNRKVESQDNKREPSQMEEKPQSVGHATASRQVLFCFIQDVLLEHYSSVKDNNQENEREHLSIVHDNNNNSTKQEEEEQQEEEEVELKESCEEPEMNEKEDNSVVENEKNTSQKEAATTTTTTTTNVVVAVMRYRMHPRSKALLQLFCRYASRGFRIVLIDHLPSLHHGNHVNAKRHLSPLVKWCEECNAHGCTISVILSIMSYITAEQRGGMNSSFTLPQTGLMQFFVQHYNSSLQPDSALSLVIGTSNRANSFTSNIHRNFAAHAGLRYVDVDELLKTND